MKIYHYTTGFAANKITADGEIKTTGLYICKNEKPAVWFSTNPNWDETVRKSLTDKKTFDLVKNRVLAEKQLIQIPDIGKITAYEIIRLSRQTERNKTT